MNEEIDLTGEERLQLINRMVQEGKKYYNESGLVPLIGGFSVIVCSLLAYFAAKTFYFPFNPFLLLIPVYPLQVFLSHKQEKKKLAKTFTDEAIDHVWAGFYITIIIVAIAANIVSIGFYAYSLCMFLAGLTSLITALIVKDRKLIVLAVLTLIIASVSLKFQNENCYLLLALAAVLVWVIPGFMMNAYLKKAQQNG